MRRRQLIKMLQGIKGNPEIVIWNGLVDDWMPVGDTPIVRRMVKQSRQHIRNNCVCRFLMKTGSKLKPGERLADIALPEDLEQQVEKCYMKQEYDLPNEFVTKERFNKWYAKRRKRIVILTAKRRNKTTFDRLGSISY